MSRRKKTDGERIAQRMVEELVKIARKATEAKP